MTGILRKMPRGVNLYAIYIYIYLFFLYFCILVMANWAKSFSQEPKKCPKNAETIASCDLLFVDFVILVFLFSRPIGFVRGWSTNSVVIE